MEKIPPNVSDTIQDFLKESSARNWEEETHPMWKTPELITYSLAQRWADSDKTVLDLGAGLGRNAKVFLDNQFYVTAIDNSAYAVEYMKNNFSKYENLSIFQADMCSLPLDTSSISNIFSFNVLEHCNSSLIEKIFSEIYRVMKPDGEIFFTITSKESSSWKNRDYPQVDENTKIKLKKGPEYGVMHYFADQQSLQKLLHNFKIIRMSHVQDLIFNDEPHNNCHYYVLAKCKKSKSKSL